MMLNAGFFESDITPRIGVDLSGFGPHLNRRSEHIRDRLGARAAVFETGGQRLVLIACDLLGLRAETIDLVRAVVTERHPEVTASEIVVCSTHTHSGPAVSLPNGWGRIDPVYLEILPYKIAAAVDSALNQREPVEMSVATVPCRGMGYNRIYEPGHPVLEEVLKSTWEPAKPELTDTESQVIKFTNPKGELKGFMAYFGCHPVVCCHQTHFIHGDYPGVAMHQLMREYPGSVGLFLQGAHGDVNTGCLNWPEPDSLLALDVIAARFANAVRNGLLSARPVAVDSLRHAVCQAALETPAAEWTPEFLAELEKREAAELHRSDADDNAEETAYAMVRLAGIRQLRACYPEGLPPTYAAPITGFRLGPLTFFGAPFEIMQAIKNETRQRLNNPGAMVLSLCGGYLGYAPDRISAANEKSYEARLVPLIAGLPPFARLNDQLVEAFVALDAELDR